MKYNPFEDMVNILLYNRPEVLVAILKEVQRVREDYKQAYFSLLIKCYFNSNYLSQL